MLQLLSGAGSLRQRVRIQQIADLDVAIGQFCSVHAQIDRLVHVRQPRSLSQQIPPIVGVLLLLFLIAFQGPNYSDSREALHCEDMSAWNAEALLSARVHSHVLMQQNALCFSFAIATYFLMILLVNFGLLSLIMYRYVSAPLRPLWHIRKGYFHLGVVLYTSAFCALLIHYRGFTTRMAILRSSWRTCVCSMRMSRCRSRRGTGFSSSSRARWWPLPRWCLAAVSRNVCNGSGADCASFDIGEIESAGLLCSEGRSRGNSVLLPIQARLLLCNWDMQCATFFARY